MLSCVVCCLKSVFLIKASGLFFGGTFIHDKSKFLEISRFYFGVVEIIQGESSIVKGKFSGRKT